MKTKLILLLSILLFNIGISYSQTAVIRDSVTARIDRYIPSGQWKFITAAKLNLALKNLNVSGLNKTTDKDATSGYVGLTTFKLNLKNSANTFTSYMYNTNSASRSYRFPNVSMTVADSATVGTLSSSVTTGLGAKVDTVAQITAETKTKITYNKRGLVTAGTDATTADIAVSSNKFYINNADTTLLNSGKILTVDGSAAKPAVGVGADSIGLYQISASQLGVTVDGLVGGWNTTGLFTGYITEQITGSGITFSKSTIQKRTSTAFTANATLTAAEIAKGLITITSGTDTLTLPTATNLGTQLGAETGTTFDFVVQNSASGGTALLVVNTGITKRSAIGAGGEDLTVPNSATTGTSGFRITFLSDTVAIISRLY